MTKSWGRSGQGTGLGEFSNVLDIAVDGFGLIYVADYSNRRVQGSVRDENNVLQL